MITQQSDHGLGPVLNAIEGTRTAMADEARKHLSSHAAMVQALYDDRIREYAQRDFDNIVAPGEKMPEGIRCASQSGPRAPLVYSGVGDES